MAIINLNNKITLIGGPFSPIGMGEHLRCTYRSFKGVAVKPRILNLDPTPSLDIEIKNEYIPLLTNVLSEINIFHINGNQVKDVLNLPNIKDTFEQNYNIIYPLWELEQYPTEWAKELDRFDEIWAPSFFIQKALENACQKPIKHMPIATEIELSSFKPRRYFNIPESDYTFLFFFDLRSFYTRKNPFGIITCFREIFSSNKYKNARLILKINGAELNPAFVSDLKEELNSLSDKINFFTQLMTDNEVKNLIRCCDCFISLHRSEGFGKGMAEALVLGKPVIATGYSGNMDFMSPEFSYPLDYRLIPLQEGEYPYYENQVWADPDLDQAVYFIKQLLDNPKEGRAKGALAKRHMLANFSYNSIGLNYLKSVEEIFQMEKI